MLSQDSSHHGDQIGKNISAARYATWVAMVGTLLPDMLVLHLILMCNLCGGKKKPKEVAG